MKSAILALVTACALFATTSTADARPPRYHGGNHGGHHGSYYGGYRGGYYGGYRAYPRYYGGYNRGYYPSYSSGGFFLNLGRLGLGIGNGYTSPYYGGYGGYYGYPWWY